MVAYKLLKTASVSKEAAHRLTTDHQGRGGGAGVGKIDAGSGQLPS
jgi:hypothetical protein